MLKPVTMFVSIELHNKVVYGMLVYIPFAVFFWKERSSNSGTWSSMSHPSVFAHV